MPLCMTRSEHLWERYKRSSGIPPARLRARCTCIPSPPIAGRQRRSWKRILLDPNFGLGTMMLPGFVGAEEVEWSGRRDLNSRPLAPQASALPGCATSRPGRIPPLRRSPEASRQLPAKGFTAQFYTTTGGRYRLSYFFGIQPALAASKPQNAGGIRLPCSNRKGYTPWQGFDLPSCTTARQDS